MTKEEIQIMEKQLEEIKKSPKADKDLKEKCEYILNSVKRANDYSE